MGDGVFPVHADARALPFLSYLAQFVKSGGLIGMAGVVDKRVVVSACGGIGTWRLRRIMRRRWGSWRRIRGSIWVSCGWWDGGGGGWEEPIVSLPQQYTRQSLLREDKV